MIDFFLHPVQLSIFAHKYVKLSADVQNQLCNSCSECKKMASRL